MFVDRERELKAMKDELKNNRSSFIVIYGRRRVGKTTLIKEFVKDERHVYYLATELPIEQQFRDIQRQAGRELGNDLLMNEPFNRWEDFFDYVTDLKVSLVLIIDEFPYLVQTESAIPSIFQKGWDEHLKNSNVDMVLCGSSISMMEDHVLKSNSPLYGRKTSQLKLKELPLYTLEEFLPKTGPEEIIRYYSVYGGVPAYLEMLDPDISFEDNLVKTILRIDAPLKDAVDFILRTELRKPERYRGILSNIARGVTSLHGLSQAMGMKGNEISQYLSRLQTLGLIKREEPVTMSPKKRKRRGRYDINDKFFRFYFYHVLPNRSDVEEGKYESVLHEFGDTESSYISPVFEEICREYVKKNMDYSKVGRWWYKEEEIDIVALDEKQRKILLGECKWTKRPVERKVYYHLLEKADKVRWKHEEKRYAIFSRSGFSDDLRDIDDPALSLYDLDDIRNGLIR